MGEIVNLRRERKRKARAEESAAADGRRVQFGLSKAERDLAESRRDKSLRDLEAHRLTPPRDES